jgi:hypothetical protein
MPRPLSALTAVLAALLAGCASVACAPATIVVAGKEERPRLRTEARGLRTDETGRVREVRRDVIVTEHWVQDQAGHWYRVSEPAWRASTAGQSMEVCR